MGSLRILPWSMGGLGVKKLFFSFFLINQSSVVTLKHKSSYFSYTARGYVWTAIIEVIQSFFFSSSFAHNGVSCCEWINHDSCECHKTLCAKKKKKWYQKWIWHPSLNSLEEPWKCEMTKRIWNAFAESIVSQPWSQVPLKSIGNDRTCDDSWLAMLLGNACSLCRAGDWKVAGLIPTKYNQCT